MSFNKRQIIIARREIADTVAAAFLPFERSAHDAATNGALTVAAVLQAHAAAALPPSAGREAVELLSEAARFAAIARDHIVKAHDILRDLPAEHNLPTATGAECPPNVGSAVIVPFASAA